MKVNEDASFKAQSRQGVVSAVLRGHKGGLIAASNEQLEHVADAGTAEAYALRHGLLLVQQLGISKLVVESDCLEVINTMNNGGFMATGAAAIYSDCLVLIIGYASVTFVHCPREANSVSHELARLARPSPSLWVEEPPAFIVKGLVDDVTIL